LIGIIFPLHDYIAMHGQKNIKCNMAFFVTTLRPMQSSDQQRSPGSQYSVPINPILLVWTSIHKWPYWQTRIR